MSVGSPSAGLSRERSSRAEGRAFLKANGVSVPGSIDSVLLFDKLGRVEVDEAEAGDIVAIVGLATVEIGDTIAAPSRRRRCRESRSASRP